MPNKQSFREHAERMLRLHRRILTGPRFIVADYAKSEGVSDRQVHLDIAAMRAMGLPICTGTPKNRGYYYETPPAWPHPQFTLPEADALVALLESQEHLDALLLSALRRLRGL
jgi:predicted DNA-binding transcriptional regulator YafY